MTVPKLFSEKWLDRRLLGNLVRRRTVHSLVAFLAVFFSLAVPLMLFGSLSGYRAALSAAERLESILSSIDEIFAVYTVATCALGIYFGAVTMRYMMDRRSAVFCHALPQRRRTLLMTSIVAAQISMLIGVLIGLGVSLCVMAARGMFLPAAVLSFWIHVLKNAVFYLSIYALAVFMGSFAGGTAVQVLLSVVSLGYFQVMIAMIAGMHAMNAPHFDMTYYLDRPLFYWTSPACWFVYGYVKAPSVWQYLLWVLIALCLLVAAFLIYRRRAIENAGKPIVYSKVGSLVKYMLMAAAALVGDLFFCLFDESFAIFGLVCGIFLSFIICNTILAKSPKGMFKGVKGLIVFAIAAAAVFAVWQADIFHIDDYLPKAGQIAYAEVNVNEIRSEGARITDAETISALLDVLNEEEDDCGAPYPTASIEVVLHQKFGPPLARRYNLSSTAKGMRAFLNAYADHADLDADYRDFVAKVRALTDPQADIQITLGDDYAYNWYNGIQIKLLLELYEREIGVLNAERLSAPAVGYFTVYSVYERNAASGVNDYLSYNGYNAARTFPVYADMTSTLAYLAKTESANTDQKLAPEELSSAIVCHTDPLLPYTGEYDYDYENRYPSATLTAEETAALLPYLVELDATPHAFRPFVDIDTAYYVAACYGDPKITDDSGAPIPTGQERTLFFCGGAVPESVKNLFK